MPKGLKCISTPSTKYTEMPLVKDYKKLARKQLRCSFIFNQEKINLHLFRSYTEYKSISTSHLFRKKIDLT